MTSLHEIFQTHFMFLVYLMHTAYTFFSTLLDVIVIANCAIFRCSFQRTIILCCSVRVRDKTQSKFQNLLTSFSFTETDVYCRDALGVWLIYVVRMLWLFPSCCNSFVCFGWCQSPAASDSGSTGTNSQGSNSLRGTPPVTLPHEGGHSTGAPNSVIPSLSSSTSGMTTLQSVTSMAASLAAVAALSSNMSHSGSGPVTNIPGVPTPPGAMPFYPPPPHHHGGLFPHWYLSPPHSHIAGRSVPSPTVALADGLRLEAVPSVKQEHSTTPPIVMALPPSSSTSEQPLDLSAKAVVCGSDSAKDCKPVTTPSDQQQSLKVPNIDTKHIFK